MRIALCLCGKLGGTEKDGKGAKLDANFAYKHYKKHLLNINNVDIFIHNWNLEDQNQLNKLYKPVKFIYENQIFNNNVKSRFESIKRCLNMVKEYQQQNNFKYDYVMISRFDVALLTDFRFNEFPQKRFIATHWNDRNNTNNHIEGFYDLWFIATLDNFLSIIRKTKEEDFNLNPHFFWRRVVDKVIPREFIHYHFFIGKDFELVRRYYYYPNNGDYNEHQVKINLNNFKNY